MRFSPLPVPSQSKELNGGYFSRVWRQIASAVNELDERNFPRTLDGDALIKAGSLALTAHAVTEWYVPLVLNSTAFSTTSTADVDASGYFNFDPAKWPSKAVWHFEATIYSANAAATATATLHGSKDYAAVTQAGTTATLVRSAAFTPPASAENIWVRVKTSNASYGASLLSARLVMIP